MSAEGELLVVLCGHGRSLAAWLSDQGIMAEVVPASCAAPDRALELLASSSATRGVVAVCGGQDLSEEGRLDLRRAGKEPEAFLVVDPWVPPDGEARARLVVWGAVNRIAARPAVRPSNLTPYLPSTLSRRALLQFPPLAYRVVPRVEPDRCRAEQGCTLCEAACPVGAIRVQGRRVVLDRARCTACGACVESCPSQALVLPGHSAAEVAAHVRAVLDPAVGPPEPRGIVYTCRRMQPDAAWHPAWFPVPVACVGGLAVSWILAPLALGAAAVAVAPCTCGGSDRADRAADERVEFCRRVLAALGVAEERVHTASLLEPPHNDRTLPQPGGYGEELFATGPQALLAIGHALAGPELAGEVEHPASPAGLVEIHPAVCTGCGMCAGVCPTSALSFQQEIEAVLWWDPARCVGCEACIPVCPERERGAIQVCRTLHLGELRKGKRELYREPVARCVACGEAIAPSRMLERVVSLLGSEGESYRRVLTQYCSTCRALSGGGYTVDGEAKL